MPPPLILVMIGAVAAAVAAAPSSPTHEYVSLFTVEPPSVCLEQPEGLELSALSRRLVLALWRFGSRHDGGARVLLIAREHPSYLHPTNLVADFQSPTA
jgi:hypothetical protein